MSNVTPYHTLFRITTFSAQVCALWLHNKDNWEENMTRHDLKADLMYLRAGDQNRAIGVITNRTWNYWTASGGTCGVTPYAFHYKNNGSKKDSVKLDIPQDVSPGTGNNKLKVMGMKTAKYNIYYYNAKTLDLEKIQIGEWGPKLNLKYPTLTGSSLTGSTTMPFVLFKIVKADGSSVNPAMQLSDERTLAAEQLLVKDSITQQVNLENRDTIHVQNTNNKVKLYPNPASDFVNLEIEHWRDENYSYTLSNSMGQVLINSTEIKDRITKIDVSKFQKGVYQIKVVSDKQVLNLQIVAL